MTTLHANSSREALRRLEGMVLMSGMEFPLRVIRENISGAVDLVVNVQRSPDGKRRVTEIMEVGNMESEVILTQGIFRFTEERGFFAEGFVPRFVEQFKARGIEFPKDFFGGEYRVRQIKK